MCIADSIAMQISGRVGVIGTPGNRKRVEVAAAMMLRRSGWKMQEMHLQSMTNGLLELWHLRVIDKRRGVLPLGLSSSLRIHYGSLLLLQATRTGTVQMLRS